MSEITPTITRRLFSTHVRSSSQKLFSRHMHRIYVTMPFDFPAGSHSVQILFHFSVHVNLDCTLYVLCFSSFSTYSLFAVHPKKGNVVCTNCFFFCCHHSIRRSSLRLQTSNTENSYMMQKLVGYVELAMFGCNFYLSTNLHICRKVHIRICFCIIIIIRFLPGGIRCALVIMSSSI